MFTCSDVVPQHALCLSKLSVRKCDHILAHLTVRHGHAWVPALKLNGLVYMFAEMQDPDESLGLLGSPHNSGDGEHLAGSLQTRAVSTTSLCKTLASA